MSCHPRDFSPLGWAVRETVESLDRAPKRWEGIAYLTLDAPHAACFSSHGSTAADCAPVAWRLAYVVADCAGEPITFDQLDHAMGSVVNDHDDVRAVIASHGHSMYR